MIKQTQNNTGLSFHFGAACDSGKCPDELARPLVEAAEWLRSNASANTTCFGWYNLPDQDTAPIEETAALLKTHDAIVHVGIGGSALGNLMLHNSLLPMYYNEQAPGSGTPRFYLADNPDPDKALAIWERVKGSRVALIGVSKSGATAETMSQFMWFREQMRETYGDDTDRHVLVITDPKNGVFRALADAVGCRSLEIPPSVGGRFSVLSPSGLVTLAALGGDIRALLAGAAEMRKLLESNDELGVNPAHTLAAVQRYHERAGRPMTVMMPYGNRLETFADWFVQLWAESLGKNGMGTTPLRALGAIDQHSQVQLFAEGPNDKLYTLIMINHREGEIVIPQPSEPSLAPMSYMASQKMGEMLNYEAMSSASALIKAGRPVIWIEAEKIDARVLGALIFFYEYVTAVSGRVMGINPFDQPGVEQGKRYTYGLMGREAFEADADEAKRYFEQAKSKA